MQFNITERSTGFNTSSYLTYSKFCSREDFEILTDASVWDRELAKFGEKKFICPKERTFKLILRSNTTHTVADKGLMMFNLLTSKGKDRAENFMKRHLLRISFAQ